MDKEQIIALAEKADETATQYLQCAGEYHPDYHSVRDEHFYHAAISAYKAELLKEVGEPVNACPVGVALNAVSHVGAANYDHREREARRWIYEAEKQLFTSDQVAAAILKVTKPLEDQLAAAQEEIARLKATPPDKREDLRCVISDLCHQVRERDAQLAKAEQRVAEACALQVATETRFHWLDAARVAKEIRSGEWRKFVKEV